MTNNRSQGRKTENLLSIPSGISTAKRNSCEVTFRPAICKKSLKIAKNLESSKKRLLTNPEKNIESTFFEFKPRINEKSLKIIQRNKSCDKKVWESLYELSISRKIKLENARKAQVNEIDKDYTFKPIQTTQKKKYSGVIMRNSNWLKSKIEKINLKIQQGLDKGLEECTFTPEIHGIPSNTEENIEDINGVQNFLYRIQSARKDKPDAQAIEPKNTYKNLTKNQYSQAIKNLNEYLHSIDIT